MPLRALTMNRKAAVQMIAYWPRNPRKIESPAQIREILDLAA